MITLTYPEAIFLGLMIIIISYLLGFTTNAYFSAPEQYKKDILLKFVAIGWSLLWALLTGWSLFTEGQSVSLLYDAAGLTTIGFVFGKTTAEKTIERTVKTVKQVKELSK